MSVSFPSLGLAPELLRALDERGYQEPTPIQREAIPLALQGRDVVGCAQTGTGKTAAFLLPILQRLQRGRHGILRALVLVPTRELAEQVLNSARAYGRHAGVSAAAVYGGVSMDPQTRALRRGVDIVVATPGRLLDHMGRGNVDFSRLEVLVLDEADRMLDMGFAPDVHRILEALPDGRQTLFFSATISDDVDRLARRALNDHAAVDIGRRAEAADGVEHVLVAVDLTAKRTLLATLLSELPDGRTLVFTRTKFGAEKLARHLGKEGHTVAALHGDKTQGARNQALDRFREGRARVLVATDVAARGIDVDGIAMVVNYDVPEDPEVYVHRVGRTARAGAAGVALTLMAPHEWLLIRDIERLMGRTLQREIVPGFEPAVSPPEPEGSVAASRPVGPSVRPRRGGARKR
ncbi:MAG TPA: DEAD/DEAH box helicase [Gemmatimonadales bacterium]|nr:DEAD/DEAH box helicase [Gemmatimonadales bacterium]